MELAEINFTAIGIGTIAALLLGIVWYAKGIFGTMWEQELGHDPGQRGSMASTFGPVILLLFVVGIVMSAIMPASVDSIYDGALFGAIIGLGLVISAQGINFLFACRSMRLFLIEAGYLLFSFVIIGAVIAFFAHR